MTTQWLTAGAVYLFYLLFPFICVSSWGLLPIALVAGVTAVACYFVQTVHLNFHKLVQMEKSSMKLAKLGWHCSVEIIVLKQP